MRQELQPALELARALAPDDLAEFLGELEIVRVTALARIAAAPELPPDRNIDASEASERLHVSKSYLYRNAEHFPFTRKEGRKVLFSANALELYLRKKR
jgi:hypothetical protein